MKKKFKMTPLQILAGGFIVLILLGALLLMLPAASRDGKSIPFLNALLTSASATCVTGLVVYDTYTQFSVVGQAIILILIQIGGLGFISVISFMAMAARKRIGLAGRSYLMESIGALQLGGVIRLLRRVLLGTAIFEGVGAILLATRFIPEFGWKTGTWYALFHAVSAFCNAGFDLMGRIEPYCSLVPFQNDIVVNLTISSLIMVGGIGFLVWDDIIEKKWHFTKYRLHSKIMLTVSAGLVLTGTVLFFLLEQNAAFKGMSFWDRLLASYFQSVSPRTAGFNSVDLAALSESGNLLTILLMFIGAGPGSTGGGLKITTIAVLVMTAVSFSVGSDEVNMFKRRLEKEAVHRAFSVTVLYVTAAVTAMFAILWIQPELAMKDVLFESFSAIGTVGLTTGITRSLVPASRLIIILLMYLGRVGSLSVVMAVTLSGRPGARLKNPEEKIVVG